jgi:hypothetical protein
VVTVGNQHLLFATMILKSMVARKTILWLNLFSQPTKAIRESSWKCLNVKCGWETNWSIHEMEIRLGAHRTKSVQ